ACPPHKEASISPLACGNLVPPESKGRSRRNFVRYVEADVGTSREQTMTLASLRPPNEKKGRDTGEVSISERRSEAQRSAHAADAHVSAHPAAALPHPAAGDGWPFLPADRTSRPQER